MGTIKIGQTYVPVIGEYELTGQPAQHPTNAVLTAVAAEYPIVKDLYDLGVAAGYSFASSTHAGSETSVRSTSAYITGGRTGLHDNSELIVTVTANENEPPQRYLTFQVVRQDGEQSVQLDASGPNSIANPLSASSNKTLVENARIFAVRYKYPDASTEAGKRWGYFIGLVTRHDDQFDNGNINTTFNRANSGWWVPIGYINQQRELDLYYDEEIPPEPEPEDPNDEGEPSDEDGGDGDHTPIYDPIPVPNKPTLGAANAGFITMYKLGLAAINTFASDMFASTVWEAIRLFFSNPIDFLVGCMLLPFEPSTGSSYRPKFGLVAFEHAYPAVDDQYKDIDCGSITIDKYWGSAFDFEPFTKIQIWLPYIGYRDLPVDEIMGMTVSVKYRVDCLTGDCVAFVYTGVVGQIGPQVERVIAQFYGNCGVRVPFGSVSFDSAVAASIQLMGAAATIGLSPGSHGTPAMQKGEGGTAYEGIVSPQDVGLINAGINVVSSMKPTVQKGGASGSSTGYMSIQKPYIIRRIPRQNLPSNFMNLKGYPSNIGGTLAEFSGLAVVDDIQLNNIPAMEDERKEIITWLKGGVLI